MDPEPMSESISLNFDEGSIYVNFKTRQHKAPYSGNVIRRIGHLFVLLCQESIKSLCYILKI